MAAGYEKGEGAGGAGGRPPADRAEVQLPESQGYVAESLGYAIKRRLLGPPLVNEQLGEPSAYRGRWRSACCLLTASHRPPTAQKRS